MKRLLWSKRVFPWRLSIILLAFTLVFVFSGMAFGWKAHYKDDEVYGSYTDKGAVHGGTLRAAWNVPPRSFDPHVETAAATTTFCNMTYNGLLRLAPRMDEIELDAAKSWRQIGDLTYEFKLRKGVRFHDIPPVNGREVTSADVKYSIERISGMHGRSRRFKHQYYFKNKLAAIETPDKYTVIVKTKEPYGAFMSYVGSPFSAIVPKEAVDQFGDLRKNSIGTGPFILKDYQRDAHIILEKNISIIFK